MEWAPAGQPASLFQQTLLRHCLMGKSTFCSGNFAWVDWKYTNSPGVPVMQSAVHDYADRQYSGGPNKFRKLNVVIAVDSTDKPPSLPFLPMTPQEDIVAPYVALAKSMAGVSLADSDVDDRWLA